MFGIGMNELLLVLALALIIIGPKKLPEIAKALGRGLAEFKRATDEFKTTLTEESRVAETRDQLLREGKIRAPGADEDSVKEASSDSGEDEQAAAEEDVATTADGDREQVKAEDKVEAAAGTKAKEPGAGEEDTSGHCAPAEGTPYKADIDSGALS